MSDVEHLLPAGNKLGECPLWHREEQVLYWVDIEQESSILIIPKVEKKKQIRSDSQSAAWHFVLKVD